MVRVQSSQLDIGKIADSGQIFRMNHIGDSAYELIAFGKLLKIEKQIDGAYKFNCEQVDYKDIWEHYFDMDTDYNIFADNVPESDKFLVNAVKYSQGIRILNQEPWEMLISFIISQRKSIPAIKTCIEKICERFGKRIEECDGVRYMFPTPSELATASIDELTACSVGYRASYIYTAAHLVASGELELEQLDKLDDDKLMEELLKVRGVGIKVANCVMLFGYHRIAAFPIDVWIKKMIDEHYDGNFPFMRYQGYAGVIQQYIFFYGRERAKIMKR